MLLRHHTFNFDEKLSLSTQLLLACDGTWVSSSFNDTYRFLEKMTPEEQETYAIENDESLIPYAIELLAPENSDVLFAEKISSKSVQLCRIANKEPKNRFIPISQSGDENEVFKTTSLVTGTASRVGGTIDVWMRSTEYKRIAIISPDGTPLTKNGVVQKRSVPTGAYTMLRSSFDCQYRRMGTYEVLHYVAGKITPETESIPREQLRLNSVTPNTVGESQLDWVCALYSPTKK